MRSVDVDAQAETEWVEKILAQNSPMKQLIAECTPSFYNNEGNPDARPGQNTFITNTTEYFKILQDWRDNNAFEGLEPLHE